MTYFNHPFHLTLEPAKNRRGLTFIENLISLALLTALIVSILGGFYISKLSAMRAKHKVTAMNLIREYMEKEICVGYNNGNYFTFASGTPVTSVIDQVTYSVAPNPIVNPNSGLIDSSEGTNYKTIGFVVICYTPSGTIESTERAVTYVADQHA